MAAQTGPLTSFTVFPTLPYELRCIIWWATCVTRVVEIEYDEEEGFTPRCCDPIALKVCKESRDTIIQAYPLCFGSIFHPAKTRFNFILDTLYIDNELEENVPHFFSTFGPLEISSLQTLALEDCYNEIVTPYEPTITTHLHKMVRKLPALRELCIVYNIGGMTDRQIGCTDGHAIELYTKVPGDLDHPAVMIEPLPRIPSNADDADPLGFRLWNIQVEPMYGWRRCPHAGPAFSDLNEMEGDDMSDGSRYDLHGPWGAPHLALTDMFGDFYDSDDMYGFGEDFDEYSHHMEDEDSDDDEDEDDEDEDRDGASVDFV
ncbi:hypothetical protein WAI453_007192 [Rhynchosporium graminicola]